jgi:hypothetical protein
MDQDILAYLKEQSIHRLLYLINDADNYDPGVGEAAKNELLDRGYSEAEIALFLANQNEPVEREQGGPLDAIWLKNKTMRSAGGLLLFSVFLLIIFLLKTVFQYAWFHFQYGAEFGFELSFFNLFLPLSLAAFSAYSIWKLLPIAWYLGQIFSYLLIFLSIYRLYRLFYDYHLKSLRDFMPTAAELDLNLLFNLLFELFVAVFVLSQVHRRENTEQFGIAIKGRRSKAILIPLSIFALLFIAYLTGVLR